MRLVILLAQPYHQEQLWYVSPLLCNMSAVCLGQFDCSTKHTQSKIRHFILSVQLAVSSTHLFAIQLCIATMVAEP